MVRRAAASLLALVVLAGCGGSDKPKANPDAGTIADPLAYDGTRQAEFEARATAGLTPVLVEKSPGGVVATARRVARFRPLIERAAANGPVDADTLEALVFLESAGRQFAQAGNLEGAAGLTQILAQTASGLLGMHVDLRKAKKARTVRALRRADDRFDPAKALAGTVRYLRYAKQKLGRTDLAIASYHMGIGNLQRALSLYGASDIPYTQLYFDSTPLNHAAAWRLLYGLGDDSSTYLWRVLAAKRLMKLYRTDRGALSQVIAGNYPPPPGTPRALSPGHGLRYPKGASLAPRAASVAETIGSDVQRISGTAPLTIRSAKDGTFYVSRRYRSPRQALAFQFMLDRLSALSLIDWGRQFDRIVVEVR